MSARVRTARGTAGPLERCLGALADALGEGPSEGLLVLGLDDPVLPGPAPMPPGPIGLLAAAGPAGPPRFAAPLVAAAVAVAVLHPADAEAIAPALGGRPAVAVGIPRPAPAAPERGLDTGGAPPAAIAALRGEAESSLTNGPGITWVWGGGGAALVAAAEAWTRGRAVVALPGTIDDPLLRRGGALRARSTLEAVEATILLSRLEPLAVSLASRGRRAIAGLPSHADVAERLRRALEAR